MGALLDAEERAKAGEAGQEPITDEDMRRAETEGLIDEANLTVFATWWQLGGMQQPPSITEVAEMPAALRHDLIYLLAEFGRLRRSRKGLNGEPGKTRKGRRR